MDGAWADVVCSVQAILMASQLRSLESIASTFSKALGKEVSPSDCPFGDAMLDSGHMKTVADRGPLFFVCWMGIDQSLRHPDYPKLLHE